MARGLPEPVRRAIRRGREAYRERYERLNERQQRLADVCVFLLIFTALAGPFYLLLGADWDATWLRTLTAGVAAPVLRLIGVPATSTGTLLTVGDLVIDVSRDSTGWKSFIALTALIVASRKPVRWTAYGIVGAVVTVFAANILRLVTTAYAVTVLGVEYQLLHLFLWRWGLTAVVFIAWLGWFRLGSRTPLSIR